MIDRRLHALRMVHQHGTVTAAARALYLTPSAVSQQLRSLAEELGAELLTPQGRGVGLTSEAQVILRHADALFAEWEEALADLAAVQEGSAGILRLSGFPTAVASLLAPAAAHLERAAPAVTVRVVEASQPSDSYGLVMAGEVDVALIEAGPEARPITDPRFEQRELLIDLLDLAVPHDHPFARRDIVALSEAAEEPWITSSPRATSRHLVLVACAAAGFTPRIVHEALEWYGVTALVARGLGVALLPRLTQIPPGLAVRRVPLQGPPQPSRVILTCVRSGSSRQPLIQRGLDALGHAAAELEWVEAEPPS